MHEERRPQVGKRIRELRDAQGLSLRALAGNCGLSINAISRIERDESSPTVSSLHRLATALGVSITSFFEDGIKHETVFTRHDRRMRSYGDGVSMESLGSGLPNQQIEAFLMTLEPGTDGGPDSITHSGEEFIFCLQGEGEYQVGEEKYSLKVGDSLLFQASQPHICRNTSLLPMTILLIMQAAPLSAPSQRQHLEF